jgi:endonuclease YncB( thermonuclease family)
MPYLMYALFFILLTNPLFAHGGGLNKVGSHNKRKIGDYHCHRGQEAKNKLDKIIAKKLVTCSKKDMDRYRRVVAVCRAGSINLNAWMVENGWAVAYIRFSKDYVKDERNAKVSLKEIWRGQFIMPWDWRKNNTLVSGDIIY